MFTGWGLKYVPGGKRLCTRWELNVYGVGELDGYRTNLETFTAWMDVGLSVNMEYATGWVTKKVTSNQNWLPRCMTLCNHYG